MDDGNLSSVRKLVSRIEAEIANEAAAGSVLGTESELCARYGVSTTIFRQAARILEAADLAMTRRGNGGGLVVNGYSIVGAAKTVATYLEFRGAKVADMLPVSARFFEMGIMLASERMTLAAADQLRVLHAEISAAPTGFERGMRNLEFNHQMVAAAGNPVLALIYRVAQHFYANIVSFHGVTEEAFVRAEAWAGELLEALINCERERLPSLLQRSVATNRRNMEYAISRPASAPNSDVARDEPLRRTLSDQVAHRMLQEILRLGWPVGQRLGAEPELMARYGVSRATLRQAVRQLEQHFAVCSRRGPGGGIFVTAPVEDRVLAVAATALRLAPAAWSDVLGVAPDLLGLALDAGLDQPDRKRIVLQGLRLAQQEPDRARAMDRVRQALAQGCGNPVVAHLLELVARLGEPPSGAAEEPGGAHLAALVDQAIQSLNGGDHARAKRALLDLSRRLGVTGQATPQREARQDQLLAS
jgi:DNA-binding FadR family transcriptional regulator